MRQPDFYRNKNAWKLILFIFALLIGAGTLWYTETFLKDLRKEEEKSVKIWAHALKVFMTGTATGDLSIYGIIMQENNTIPIIMTDGDGNVITYRNLDSSKTRNPDYIKNLIPVMAEENEPIEVEFAAGKKNIIYYQESILLKKLRIYPFVLLGVIGVFVGIAYAAFSSARRTEQDRVWSGMAKETAHQIGTPLSSLMGWIELLRVQGADEDALSEMSKDVDRLETITSRFSKIGSVPQLELLDIITEIEDSLDYLRRRTSNKIDIRFKAPDTEIVIPINRQLFSWVIENLIRNAIDAIEGPGYIQVTVVEAGRNVRIEVEDSGKGLTRNQFKAIFRPGYTTKTRGWGLGLSLARRIIEDYHNGQIFVLRSEPGVGTTFRLSLPISKE
ncbi:MAG: HAMP domain-containing histidine kinase [Bacteroidetes bacterium]|uniref:histidine kinase n=1 Tax=Phaeocystidibacter marisrubri TaxID=1577780 RepID=A0A6L3ZD99_9FLAO|nr:HAMP domain-containing sensor histidine kinase [Phaeocystidibacter marisrubri]KAB2815203.1 HAMP domain-containing histidine kinase [Phaeocystidibacter marisrubri]TNE27448.1 MAG: HAMP domain-containing histidine kinase [Bacteroidota bacterium]GGH70871.1 two-component sensor histidine kinase [Phaeocystidibacter marisrubri]